MWYSSQVFFSSASFLPSKYCSERIIMRPPSLSLEAAERMSFARSGQKKYVSMAVIRSNSPSGYGMSDTLPTFASILSPIRNLLRPTVTSIDFSDMSRPQQ